MENRGMNERIRELRRQSVETQPRICMERALIQTRVYKELEGTVSIPELRAHSLLRYQQRRTLYFGENELILGEKASGPQAAPTFPELCCHTLEDMRIMNDRELISFSVGEADLRAQAEVIIPFWEKRSMRKKLLSEMTGPWQDCYSAGLFTEFMEQRGPGHTVGSGIIYEKGFLKFQQEIDEALSALDYHTDAQAHSKAEQLRAMRVASDAVMELGRRYLGLAKEQAEACQDPRRKAELLQMAENLEVVPAHAPQTYWQALQMYWFVHLCVTTELNPWDAYSPGRLDQHLYPFYKRDVASGVLTREGAKELLECLFVKFNNQPAPPKVGITLKESGTYTDFANINTGGVTPLGEDGANDVSYLILECMDEMRLLQPSSNVQISAKTPRAFLERACRIARQGWGQPAFYNTEGIVAQLLRAGKTLEDALVGGASGCVETGSFGNEAYILTGYFNLPKVLEITLHNGIDPQTGKRLGPETGAEFDSFEALYRAFEGQLRHFIDIKVAGSNLIEQLYARYMPVPFLSVVTRDCISAGRDYNAGGARYNTSYLQGVGIGTIADALSAIKKCVYDEKDISMPRLMRALSDNFEGEGLTLARLRAAPKYGNDDLYADELMRRVFLSYEGMVTGRPNARGGEYRINMLPTTCHIYFGEVVGATADGRGAGKPLSEGISPSQGADKNGPTAVLSSAARMEQVRTGGTLLNQKFTPAVLKGDRGISAMADFITAYFQMGGHHIQFNVVDRQVLRDAQQNPEEHRGLIVRVAGYSDYFRNLSRGLQDEIIARTEQAL